MYTDNDLFDRPLHKNDDNRAHIKFGEDPKPNLKKYGYCVVENILTEFECNNTINKIWDWLEGLGTGIKRNDPKTWSNEYWPFCIRAGLIQHTMAHEDFIWNVREHPNILYSYSQIYGTDKLLASFGSLGVYRPIETGYVTSSTTSWIHTDQNIVNDLDLEAVYDSKEYSIQGIMNLEDSGDKDAGFFIGEGSHLLHSKLFQHNKKHPENNWYVITKDDLIFLENNNIIFYKINAPKGSFTLFDSRAFHCGFPHQKDREIPKFRYTLYITLAPAQWSTEYDLEKKNEAIKSGRNTSHWSTNNNVVIFPIPKNNCTYMTRKENIPDWKNWSIKRKNLAGLVLYK